MKRALILLLVIPMLLCSCKKSDSVGNDLPSFKAMQAGINHEIDDEASVKLIQEIISRGKALDKAPHQFPQGSIEVIIRPNDTNLEYTFASSQFHSVELKDGAVTADSLKWYGYGNESDFNEITKMYYDGIAVNAKVTGSFVATVRQLSPNYMLDSVTPNVAVLTCFQSSPFMVSVGEEMAKELVVGESYYFEIEDMDIGFIPKDEFDGGCPSLESAFSLYNLHIKSFRQPQESEYGLESVNVIFEEIKI